MGGSGYRPSRDTAAALYGAERGWPMLRHKSDGISGPYSIENTATSRLGREERKPLWWQGIRNC